MEANNSDHRDHSFQETNVYPLDKLRRRFMCLNPDLDAKELLPGDVIVSSSGNARLLLSQNKSETSQNLHFISFINRKNCLYEESSENNIDRSKIRAIIRRRDVKPITNFEHLNKNMAKLPSLVYNTGVLLQCGELGLQIQELIERERPLSATVTLIFYTSLNTKKIIALGTQFPNPNIGKNLIELYTRPIPENEYIKRIKMYPQQSQELKTELTAACVYATTIENALRFCECF
jgi:hypothetical protein